MSKGKEPKRHALNARPIEPSNAKQTNRPEVVEQIKKRVLFRMGLLKADTDRVQ
jgi:hypothetical protein